MGALTHTDVPTPLQVVNVARTSREAIMTKALILLACYQAAAE